MAPLLLSTLALRPALVSRPPNLPAIARCPPPLLAASPPPRSPLLNPEVSLGVGVAILLLLVANRLFTEDLLARRAAPTWSRRRGIVICLGALSNLDIEPRLGPVALAGGVDWVDPAVAPGGGASSRGRPAGWASRAGVGARVGRRAPSPRAASARAAATPARRWWQTRS